MKNTKEVSEFERELEAEPRARKGRVVSVFACANDLGISRSVIQRLIAEGMLVEPGGKVATAIVVQRLRDEAREQGRDEGAEADDGGGHTLRKLDPDDIRARKTVAEIEKIERHNRIEAGEFVAIPDVLDIVGAEYAVVRAGLSAIPGRIEQELASLSGLEGATVRRVLSAEIGAALNALGQDAALAPLKNGVEHDSEPESFSI